MRFVRIELGPPTELAAALSPRAAVLEGLSNDERLALIDAFRAVFAGDASAATAWIVVDQTLVPLTAGLTRPLSKLLRGLDPVVDATALGLDVAPNPMGRLPDLSASIDAPLARMVAIRAALEIQDAAGDRRLTPEALRSTLEAVRTKKATVPVALRLQISEAQDQARAAREALSTIDEWERSLDAARRETETAEEKATKTFSYHRSFLRFVEARARERDRLQDEGFESHEAFKAYVRSAVPSFRQQLAEAEEDGRVAAEALRLLEAGRYDDPEYRQLTAEEYSLDLRLQLEQLPVHQWGRYHALALQALEVLAESATDGSSPTFDRRDLVTEARRWLAAKESQGSGLEANLVYAGPEEQLQARASGELRAQIDRHRNLPAVGSVPLILDRTFDGLPSTAVRPLLRMLEDATEHLQVIYIGAHPVLSEWAEGLPEG